MNCCVNLGFAHAGAAGNERLQLGEQNVVADLLFKLGGRQIRRRCSMSSYSAWPMKLPPGKNVAA